MSITPKKNLNDEVNKFLSSKILRNKKINYITTDNCIGHFIKNGQYWEEWMLKYISMYYVKGTNMLDLGANIGTTSLLMSEVLSTNNKIYSFEPIYHDIMYKNIIENNVSDKIILYSCGVGNNIDKFVYKKINYSENNNFGATSIQNCNIYKNPDENEFVIPIEKIDNYNFDNVSLIKIDVENMEMMVLEGAFGLISKCKPTIIMETYQYNDFINSDIFLKLRIIGYKLMNIPEGSNDFLLICNK